MSRDQTLRIDIVSDVVCPWCIIGYKRLERALAELREVSASIHWRPFELNPTMPPEGQNLREHLALKYGTTPEGSQKARAKLTALGADLGFRFHYFDEMRIWNTFRAHKLLEWAGMQGLQTALKMALFEAYFSLGQNVDDPKALADAAARAGLDRDEAITVLEDARYAEAVRAEEQRWLEAGITGVPAIVIDERYAIMGAQDPSVYQSVIERLSREQAA